MADNLQPHVTRILILPCPYCQATGFDAECLTSDCEHCQGRGFDRIPIGPAPLATDEYGNAKLLSNADVVRALETLHPSRRLRYVNNLLAASFQPESEWRDGGREAYAILQTAPGVYVGVRQSLLGGVTVAGIDSPTWSAHERARFREELDLPPSEKEPDSK